MHQHTHCFHVRTKLDAHAFGLRFQPALRAADPKGVVRVEVRDATPEERARLQGVLGQRPSIVGNVYTQGVDGLVPLVTALSAVLRKERRSWLQIVGTRDEVQVDLCPGKFDVTTLPNFHEILSGAA